jgi:hypothetical protein
MQRRATPGRGRLNESQRGFAIPSLFNVEAFGFERAADDLTEGGFVVYHQHGAPCQIGPWGRVRATSMAVGERGSLQTFCRVTL